MWIVRELPVAPEGICGSRCNRPYRLSGPSWEIIRKTARGSPADLRCQEAVNIMKRMKTFWMAVVFALIAGPLAAGLTTAAYAQGGFGVVSGTVLDPMAKPYAGVDLIVKNIETGQTFNVKTDAKGHYSIAGMAGGTYSIDLQDKGKVIYQTGFKLTGGTSPVFDMNLKEIFEKEKGANAEAEAKRVEAEKAFQGLKADVAANYNNLGNDMAKLGKVDDARAAYQKYVDLNPTDAALAWRNFGIVLYQANRMKEAIEPLQKALALDPKSAQAWYLLGVALVNTMEFKTEGDKITPVMQPGTLEAYQKAIDLDPNGPIGAQAKQGLEQLQAMGLGITTKIGKAPTPTKGKK